MTDSDASGFSEKDSRTALGVSPSVTPSRGSESRSPACAQASRGPSPPSAAPSARTVRTRRDTSGALPALSRAEADGGGESQRGDGDRDERDFPRARRRLQGLLRPRKRSADSLRQLS